MQPHLISMLSSSLAAAAAQPRSGWAAVQPQAGSAVLGAAARPRLSRWQQRGRRASGASLTHRRQWQGGAGGVAAISTPERQTVTDRTPPPPPPEVEVKVIGIGSRGAAALSKLVSRGKVGLLAAGG